jgi:hypothetical protein
MPDMASLSLSITALYFFVEWLGDESHNRKLAASCSALTLATLSKLPAVLIGLPLLFLAWGKYRFGLLLKRRLGAFAAVSLLAPLAWYYHAYQVSLSYPPYHFFGEGGIEIKDLNWYWGILRQTATSSLTPLIFSLMVAGMFLPARAQFRQLFYGWFIAIALFIFIAGEGNRHQWYRLPLVPVAAAFGGLACDLAWQRLSKTRLGMITSLILGLCFSVCLIYFSYYYTNPFYDPWGTPSLEAGVELSRISPADALVLVPDGGDPTTIYYSRRKGWHVWEAEDSQGAIAELERRRNEEADYFILPRYRFWWLNYYKEFREHLHLNYKCIRKLTNT